MAGIKGIVKEWAIPGALIAAILGAVHTSGVHAESIKNNSKNIEEVKITLTSETTESQMINMEQTIALTKNTVILEGVVKMQERQNKVLDKLLEK